MKVFSLRLIEFIKMYPGKPSKPHVISFEVDNTSKLQPSPNLPSKISKAVSEQFNNPIPYSISQRCYHPALALSDSTYPNLPRKK